MVQLKGFYSNQCLIVWLQKQGPSNTLGYILRDVRPHIPRGYMYTLHDIGLVINKLMGGAYRLLWYL